MRDFPPRQSTQVNRSILLQFSHKINICKNYNQTLETSTCNYDYFLFILTQTGKSLEIRDYLKKIYIYNTRSEKNSLQFFNGDHFKMERRSSQSISPLFWPRASLKALLWTFSIPRSINNLFIHHNGAAYSSIGLTRDLYSKENSFTLLAPSMRLMTPRTLLALLTTNNQSSIKPTKSLGSLSACLGLIV